MSDPQVLSTTTAASPPQTGPVPTSTGPVGLPDVPQPAPEPAPAAYQPDLTALQHAGGDTQVWAHEFSELIGHTTGKWIDEASIQDWMQLLAAQVTKAAYRSALFQVANTTLPTTTVGDPALLLLQLRNELAAGLQKAAGL